MRLCAAFTMQEVSVIMKVSSKAQRCALSPMRKYHPYAVEAKAKGKKIYHLNIGQPDIKTPKDVSDLAAQYSHEIGYGILAVVGLVVVFFVVKYFVKKRRAKNA